MRDYGFELEPIVIQSIMKLEESFSNGLIQNTESIGFENAKKYDKLIMLRWRKRECILCNSSFDQLAKNYKNSWYQTLLKN